tara:strand:- start:2549 stop:3175 length:627 start_codon:yes stop_codon:yes gene_type:complete
MAFWGDCGFDGGNVTEPKRAYRWIMNINAAEEWIIKKVTKPGFEITETSHQFLNHTFYYPGRLEWATIDVTLVDPMDPDTTKYLSRLVENSGYHVPHSQNTNQWVSISKNASVDAINRIAISQIDAAGSAVETWTLHNPWVKSLKFGELDYSSDEMVEITMTLRYDWASLNKGGDSTFAGDASTDNLGKDTNQVIQKDEFSGGLVGVL